MSDNSINDEDNKCSLNPSASLLASISDPPSLLSELHVADSGATANFGTLTLPVKNRRPTTNPIHLRMPNGTASTHEGELARHDIPEAAQNIHLVPDFADQSVISMSGWGTPDDECESQDRDTTAAEECLKRCNRHAR